eukprot:5325670-Karenia_brevis.AAC.1
MQDLLSLLPLNITQTASADVLPNMSAMVKEDVCTGAAQDEEMQGMVEIDTADGFQNNMSTAQSSALDTVLLNDQTYTVLKHVGAGNFANIFSVWHGAAGKHFVLKIIDREAAQKQLD